jgi:nucleosome assembly protein 1-like 1
LKAIEDIHIVDEEGTDNFTIVFEMAENEFIKNEQLTKKFYLKNDEPTKSEGSPIEWKGKNLTMKEIKKKQKNKKTGQHRVVTKTVEAKSFFNFFKSVEAPEVNAIEGNEEDLEKREKLESDFELGGILVDEVLPYSLEYYLGIEHDDDLDDEDEDMEESDEEEDEKPKKKSKSKGKK